MYYYFSTYPPNEKYSYIFSNYHYGDYPELHNHDFWEFAIIVNGSYEHTLNDKKDTLTKNTAVLFGRWSKGVNHSITYCTVAKGGGI